MILNDRFFQKQWSNVTLEGDGLKMSIDCEFKTTDSPDSKLIIDLMGGMRFDTRARAKSVGDGNLIKTYFKNRILIASLLGGSKTHEITSGTASVFTENVGLIPNMAQRAILFQKIQKNNVIDYLEKLNSS